MKNAACCVTVDGMLAELALNHQVENHCQAFVCYFALGNNDFIKTLHDLKTFNNHLYDLFKSIKHNYENNLNTHKTL